MNLLAQETSPYLLQHKDNPVHWMPWGAAALRRAQEENKPILLSVGYAACHWCHVMAHESFEDQETADLMNRHFVNVKVDREERPDVDAVYQAALALMGQAGGWPLTMFLTPQGNAFWGGTYFPPQARQGMPSFREVLRGIAQAYMQEPDKVAHNVKSLKAALEKLHDGQAGAAFSRAALDSAAAYFLSLIDPAHGGIGHAPKFPNLPALSFLWEAHIRNNDQDCKLAVVRSLTHMCQGGIYDHVGGGFSRYAVDAEWLVPHFEKMLYDNALFISLLTEVWKETGHPLFARRVAETIGWLMREMQVTHEGFSAFAASLDADSAGEEGKYYVWEAREVRDALGAKGENFMCAYDVTAFGNWEGRNILNRLKSPDYGREEEEEDFAGKLSILREKREMRVKPARDDKVMSDWNGMMIAALARAGFAFGREDWVQAAKSAFTFVQNHMMRKDNRIFHVWCQGQAQKAALLDDYAQMIAGALALYEVTGAADYLMQAQTWAEILQEDHADAEKGGYFMSDKHESSLPLRPKTAHDGATPSGNGVMALNLARLYAITGKEAYRATGAQIVAAFAGAAAHHLFPLATLMSASDALAHPTTLTANKDLIETMKEVSWPGLACIWAAGDQAHLCIGQNCLTPVQTRQELKEMLQRERSNGMRLAANDAAG